MRVERDHGQEYIIMSEDLIHSIHLHEYTYIKYVNMDPCKKFQYTEAELMTITTSYMNISSIHSL
jgi:hypothetical protein